MELYTVKSMVVSEGKLEAVINYHSAHPVFAGHFPGQPIVPGVLLMQTVREIIERHHGTEYQLVKARSVKFLRPVTGDSEAEINITIDLVPLDGDLIDVNATAHFEGEVYFKFVAQLHERR